MKPRELVKALVNHIKIPEMGVEVRLELSRADRNFIRKQAGKLGAEGAMAARSLTAQCSSGEESERGTGAEACSLRNDALQRPKEVGVRRRPPPLNSS